MVYVKKRHRPEGLRREAEGEEGRRTGEERARRTPGRSSSTSACRDRPADNARVRSLSGLKAGEEVALEDPTLDKKDDEDDD